MQVDYTAPALSNQGGFNIDTDNKDRIRARQFRYSLLPEAHRRDGSGYKGDCCSGGGRIFGDILTAIDGAESEAFKDGIELGRVYQASGVGSYADFKNKVRELLEECPPDDISEDLAKFLMDGEEDGV